MLRGVNTLIAVVLWMRSLPSYSSRSCSHLLFFFCTFWFKLQVERRCVETRRDATWLWWQTLHTKKKEIKQSNKRQRLVQAGSDDRILFRCHRLIESRLGLPDGWHQRRCLEFMGRVYPLTQAVRFQMLLSIKTADAAQRCNENCNRRAARLISWRNCAGSYL